MIVSKVLSIFFVCMLAGCGNSVSRPEEENQTQSKEKTELSLMMERSGCYGRCPIYDLIVQSDGKVMFEGKFWTKTIGKTEGRITEKQLKELVAEIEKADFFSFDDTYNWDSANCPNLATDMPGVNLRIKLNGKEKTINHYHGCFENDKSKGNSSIGKTEDLSEIIFPRPLYNLENKIDEIVETKRWIGEQQ